jgi:hypothetical protein
VTKVTTGGVTGHGVAGSCGANKFKLMTDEGRAHSHVVNLEDLTVYKISYAGVDEKSEARRNCF